MTGTIPPHYVEEQLVYLVYGGSRTYELETKFSILTALGRSRKAKPLAIRVLTDSPAAFDGWPVEVVPLTEQTLQAWTGQSGYDHRRKPCAIAWAAQWADKTLFVDTDTIFLKAPADLLARVGTQRYLVDEFEWNWSTARTRPEYAEFVAGLARDGILPDDHLRLYNSGVVGIQHDSLAPLQRCIERIDAWSVYAQGLHTIEQIALSFELHGCSVGESRDHLEHYCGYKYYVRAMLELFFERYGCDFDPAQPALALELPIRRPRPSWRARQTIKRQLRRASPELRGVARKLLYGCAMNGSDYARACRAVWWAAALEELHALDCKLQRDAWPAGLPSLGNRDELEFRVFVRQQQGSN